MWRRCSSLWPSAVGGLDVEVLSEASKSLGYRGQYWRSTVEMIADHPIMGCGPGHFQDAYTRYKLPEASEEIADPHNFLLEVWATAGTPAMLAMVAALGCFGWSLWRHRCEPTADEGENNGDRGDATAAIFGGAVVGVLAAWPLGLLGTTPPGLVVLVVGLPLGAATVVLLRPWIDAGRFPASLAAIGLSCWWWTCRPPAGWLSRRRRHVLAVLRGALRAEGPPSAGLPTTVATAIVAMFFILGAICYWTAYRPVLAAQAEIERH